MSLLHDPPPRGGEAISYTDRVRDRSDLDLALDFVAHVTGAAPSAHEVTELVAAVGSGGGPDR